MDTRDLTAHFRAATTDLEPRPGFAADVLRGGRRRRTRNRLMIGAVAVATVAVAAAVAVVPLNLADRRPADHWNEQDGHPMMTSGGDLIDDARFVRLATTTWRESIPTTLANKHGLLSRPLTEPHVTWAGSLPDGVAAVVAQQFTMPDDDTVEFHDRGEPRIAVGLLTAADETGPLTLVGVQLEGYQARPGSFVLPDDRTVIAVAYASPPDSRVLNISPNVHVDQNGVSRRDWTTPLHYADGVWIGELPAGVNPLNVRMIDSRPDLDPNDAEDRQMGLHHPLLFTSQYLDRAVVGVPDRGLQWEPLEHTLGDDPHLRGPAWDRFEEAVRNSGLLDPTSYTPNHRHWVVTVTLGDGRTVLVSTHQELDNPAYFFRVVIGADDSVEQVTRIGEVDPAAPIPLAVPLPDQAGWVVGMHPTRQFQYRTTGQWSAPQNGVVLVPGNTATVRTDTGDEQVLG